MRFYTAAGQRASSFISADDIASAVYHTDECGAVHTDLSDRQSDLSYDDVASHQESSIDITHFGVDVRRVVPHRSQGLSEQQPRHSPSWT